MPTYTHVSVHKYKSTLTHLHSDTYFIIYNKRHPEGDKNIVIMILNKRRETGEEEKGEAGERMKRY